METARSAASTFRGQSLAVQGTLAVRAFISWATVPPTTPVPGDPASTEDAFPPVGFALPVGVRPVAAVESDGAASRDGGFVRPRTPPWPSLGVTPLPGASDLRDRSCAAVVIRRGGGGVVGSGVLTIRRRGRSSLPVNRHRCKQRLGSDIRNLRRAGFAQRPAHHERVNRSADQPRRREPAPE